MGNKLYFLNVGLNASTRIKQGRKSEHQIETATSEVLSTVPVISRFYSWRLDEPNQFFAIVVRPDVLHAVCTAICDKAQQDCVAVWDVLEARGQLIGPNCADWAPFDLGYFIVPEQFQSLLKTGA